MQKEEGRVGEGLTIVGVQQGQGPLPAPVHPSLRNDQRERERGGECTKKIEVNQKLCGVGGGKKRRQLVKVRRQPKWCGKLRVSAAVGVQRSEGNGEVPVKCLQSHPECVSSPSGPVLSRLLNAGGKQDEQKKKHLIGNSAVLKTREKQTDQGPYRSVESCPSFLLHNETN